MLNLVLPLEVTNVIQAALRKAGRQEIGGILMAEHTAPDEFKVQEITVHRRGAIASFIRRIEDAIGQLRLYFDHTGHDYTRFNYLGEWHSHPSFEPFPSSKDDMSMLQIVQDLAVGANFVVLLVVKLNLEGQLIGSAHTYFPNGIRAKAVIRYGD